MKSLMNITIHRQKGMQLFIGRGFQIQSLEMNSSMNATLHRRKGMRVHSLTAIYPAQALGYKYPSTFLTNYLSLLFPHHYIL